MSFEWGNAPGRDERGRGDPPRHSAGADHPPDVTGRWYPHPGSGRAGAGPSWDAAGQRYQDAAGYRAADEPHRGSPGGTRQWSVTPEGSAGGQPWGSPGNAGSWPPPGDGSGWAAPGGTRQWSGAEEGSSAEHVWASPTPGRPYFGAGAEGTGPSGAGGGWPPPQYPGQYPPPRRPRRRLGLILVVVAVAVLAGLGAGRFALQNADDSASATTAQNPLPSSKGSSGARSTGSLNAAAIAAQVNPSIVNVNTVLGFQNRQAAGTGIVLTSEGEVLTNNHVVEGATSIQVTDVGNRRTYQATVVGYDRSHDVAVLRLRGASGLRTATIGDSGKLAVGDPVLGLGNAGGAGGTPVAAAGNVTALGQSITAADDLNGSSEQLSGLIQVDANIQSGDSGGPLVNASAQVIGVDTAASTGYQFRGRGGRGGQTGEAQGFAIPINQAMSIVRQIESGTATSSVHIGDTAFLGVSVSSASGPGSADGQDQSDGESPATGATVQQVVSDSPAQQAGLRRGDVITSVDGQDVASATALTNLMDTHHPGDRITVTWTDRAGDQHTATVVPVTGPVG